MMLKARRTSEEREMNHLPDQGEVTASIRAQTKKVETREVVEVERIKIEIWQVDRA